MKKTILLFTVIGQIAFAAAPSSRATSRVAGEIVQETPRFGLGVAYYIGGSGFLASTLLKIDSAHSVQVGLAIGRANEFTVLAGVGHYRARVLSLHQDVGLTLGAGTNASHSRSGFAMGVLGSVGLQIQALSNLTVMTDFGPGFSLTTGSAGLFVGFNAHALL